MNNNTPKLMLHSGGSVATLEQVAAQPTPEQTGKHFPLRHIDLYEEVRTALSHSNVEIESEQHALSPDGQRYFGMLQVGGMEYSTEDFRMTIGIRNSHDKRFGVGVVFGQKVIVCDNLCFTGEAVIGRKHTRYLCRDLKSLVPRCVGMLGTRYEESVDRTAAYRQKILSEDEARSLTVRAAQKGVLPSSKILKVLEEFESPTYPEHRGEDDEGSVWTLKNAFTEVQKGRNIFNLPKAQETLLGILDVTAGVHQKGRFTSVVS